MKQAPGRGIESWAPGAGNAAVKLLEESPRKAAFIKKHTKRIDLAFARKGSRELIYIHTYIHTYI